MKGILILFLAGWAALCAQENVKLSSGEGLYHCDNSNTYGRGNIFASGFGRAFYWDNPTGSTGGYPLKAFPSAGIDVGLLEFVDFGFYAELLSYGFKVPGNFKFKLKATIPNNEKLRLIGFAVSGQYMRNFLDNFASFGYRNSAVGFYPEGIMMLGNSMEVRAIADLELIQWKSFLPLKIYANLGYRFSQEDQPKASLTVHRVYPRPDTILNAWPASYHQYLVMAGLEYKGLTTDFFVEYSLEVFNSFEDRQVIVFTDGNWIKRFPYHFSENPMYLTPGLRVKYASGVSLMAAVPIKLSSEAGPSLKAASGSDIMKTLADPVSITDGYSPFYADWKIAGKLTIPIHFRMVNPEITRKFLLMKNRKVRQAIDIDESIRAREPGSGAAPTEEEKMQDEIEKRKKQLLEENQLN